MKAVFTMYGTELMEDNVDECKKNILFEILKFTSSHNFDINDTEIMKILNHNIVCTDTFKWDYENWNPRVEYTETQLF